MGYPINSKYSIYPDIIASREDISEYLFHFTKGQDAIDKKQYFRNNASKKEKRTQYVLRRHPCFFYPRCLNYLS